MKGNKNYDYTDEFSDIIHTERLISATELSELFFSAPKWITILMKFRNIMMKPFGLKKERNLSDLVHIASDNMATVCKNDKHLDLEIAFIYGYEIILPPRVKFISTVTPSIGGFV